MHLEKIDIQVRVEQFIREEHEWEKELTFRIQVNNVKPDMCRVWAENLFPFMSDNRKFGRKKREHISSVEQFSLQSSDWLMELRVYVLHGKTCQMSGCQST